MVDKSKGTTWGMVVGIGLTVLIAGGSFLGVWLYMDHRTRKGPADGVLHAALVSDGKRDLVAVSDFVKFEGKHGTSYSHRLVLLDPATGDLVTREVLGEGGRGPESRGMAASLGSFLWMVDGDRIGLRDLASGRRWTQDELSAALPAIARPWHAWDLRHDGFLQVEGDDKRKWTIDPRTLQAGPGPDSVYRYGSDFPYPMTDVWWTGKLEAGEVRLLKDLKKERHSDPDRFGLMKAPGMNYQWPIEPVERVGGAAFTGSGGRFVVDLATRNALLLADPESALVDWDIATGRDGLARVTPDGTVVWTREFPDDDVYGTHIVLPYRETLLKFSGRLLYCLDPKDGSVKWRKRL